MPAALEKVHLGAGQEPLQFVRDADRQDAVLFAPHDGYRHVDAMEPPRELRIVQPRLPGEARGGVPVLKGDIDRLRRQRYREALLRVALLKEELADRVLGREQKNVRRLGARRG